METVFLCLLIVVASIACGAQTSRSEPKQTGGTTTAVQSDEVKAH